MPIESSLFIFGLSSLAQSKRSERDRPGAFPILPIFCLILSGTRVLPPQLETAVIHRLGFKTITGAICLPERDRNRDLLTRCVTCWQAADGERQ